MFCRNCGKEISGENFCQYCGTPTSDKVSVNINKSIDLAFLSQIKQKIQEFGYERLSIIASVVTMVLTLVASVNNTTIITEYNFLAQDDYLVITEEGKTLGFILLAVNIVAHLAFRFVSKKDNRTFSKKILITLVATVIVQLLCIFFKFPALY